MTEIVINVERGSDGQPVGWLRTSSGEVVEYTGWLRLIRALEDELHREPPPPGPSLPD